MCKGSALAYLPAPASSGSLALVKIGNSWATRWQSSTSKNCEEKSGRLSGQRWGPASLFFLLTFPYTGLTIKTSLIGSGNGGQI